MGGDRLTQNKFYGWGQTNTKYILWVGTEEKKIHLMDGDRLTENTSNRWGQTKTKNLGFRIKEIDWLVYWVGLVLAENSTTL